MTTEPPSSEPESVDPAPEAQLPPAPVPVEYRHRKAPRYRAIIVTAAVLGGLVGLVLGATGPDVGKYSTSTEIGYLVALFGLLGGVVGAVVAVVLDRPRR